MDLRLKTSVATAVFALGLAAPAFAAPLSFPDVPANHWAKDAVETLAAKHIVEGYPDGTYKGDRATTRWELAMVVARLLKQIEDGQSNFATKQDLEAINRLANSLKDELEALGQRVTKLEGDVSKLDQRVTELERVTFYGSVEARLAAQCFTKGNKTWDSDNGNRGLAWDGQTAIDGYSGGVAVRDFEHEIGTGIAANYNPARTYGLLPVSDMTRGGVALSNGTGFTMKAILGLRVRVSDDVDAGAEFAAYSSVGDGLVDAMWGVQAPNSCSPFSANFSGDANRPYTRMVLDNFWVLHNPSGTKLTVGAYNENHVDKILYAGQPNLGAYGNKYLDNFGFDVNGSTKLYDWGVFRWELMGTRLGDGTSNGVHIGGPLDGLKVNSYQTNVLAADLGVEFGAGQVKVNFMHAANEAEHGDLFTMGGIQSINEDGFLVPMSEGTEGWRTGGPLQWVNPEMYSTLGGAVPAGRADQVDDRPITYNGNPGDKGLGTFGPQRMIGFSVKADYKWDIGNNNTIYAAGQYARTEYKSNKNSNYTSKGNAYKGEVGANLLDGDLDLSLAYVGTDPNYDPFVNVNPYFQTTGTLNRTDFINMNQYSNMWSLHDVDEFTHNRKGFQFNGQWRFAERRGLVWAKAKFMDQVKSSMYDNRYDGDSGRVLGFNPGFMDPVFYGYSASVFDTKDADGHYVAVEGVDHRGRHTNWGIGASYKWENPRIKVDLGYEGNNYKRKVDGAALDSKYDPSQNYVNLSNHVAHLGLGWEASDKWTIRAGCDWAHVTGHWDPYGQYNTYAKNNDVYDFDNIKVNQVVPYIGFDYDMTANTQWNLDLRYYDTRDGVDTATYANGGMQADGHAEAGYTAHPFSWYGWQVTSQFKIKF